MRHFLLTFIFVWISIFSLSAQKRGAIQTRIELVPDNELTWIRLTITNNTDKPIMLNNMSKISNQGREVGTSASYAYAVAYDNSGKEIGFSNRLSFLSFDSNSGAYIPEGEKNIQVFLLEDNEIPGFFPQGFPWQKIKDLELKVHLTYKTFVPNGITTTTKDILTNRIYFF